MPFMELHGLKDGTANYTGALNSRNNGYTTDIPSLVDAWAERDGFATNDNKTSTLCNGVKGKEVRKYSWARDGKDVVVHYRYEHVGHDWMSSFFNEDTGKKETLLTCKEAEATKLVLEWFGKWTL